MRKKEYKNHNINNYNKRNHEKNKNILSLLLERIKNRVKVKKFIKIAKGLLKNNQIMMQLLVENEQ